MKVTRRGIRSSSSVREAGRGTEAGFAGGPCTAATVSPAVWREREREKHMA